VGRARARLRVLAAFGQQRDEHRDHRHSGGEQALGIEAMRELTADYLDGVGPALAGNWRTSESY
jgi:hypothetical protein